MIHMKEAILAMKKSEFLRVLREISHFQSVLLTDRETWVER